MRTINRTCGLLTVLFLPFLAASCGGGSSPKTQPLAITTASLSNGTAWVTYSQKIHASGGVAPYTWTLKSGTLPHNLVFSASSANSATVSGTPDVAAQAVAFTVQVIDSAGHFATQAYSVSILLEPDTLVASPANLSFGMQLAGTSSSAQTLTLTNNGSSAIVIVNVGSSGSAAADFSSGNTCGGSISAGGSCMLSVTFDPTALGPRSAAVVITDNTLGSPHSYSLDGVGVTSGPNATLSSSSLSFFNQAVGTTSPSQSINLSNYGTATLSISGIAASGDFGETNNCGSSLAPAATCTIDVTFTPSTTGTLTGTLSVTDNASGSPHTVALSGTGGATGCTPIGGTCGPGLPACCTAPFPHHSVCSNPSGFGICTMT
jgi:hypothetical protein